jgi:hypothetical protein
VLHIASVVADYRDLARFMALLEAASASAETT